MTQSVELPLDPVTDAALKPMRLFHWSNSYLALVFVAAAVDPLLR